MATIVYPGAVSTYTRVISNTGLSEFHIDTIPNLVFVITGSFPNTSSIVFIQGFDTGSLYPISASWCASASYASTVFNPSASVDLSGNIVISGSITSVGGYNSSDSSAGITTTQTFKDGSGVTKTMTIKNGLITGIA